MSGNTVLIVDDSRAVVIYLKSLLQKAGYNVVTGADGQQGWEVLQAESIDLIVSDLEMPVMNGLEFCKRVKQDERFKHIYFIILSSRNEQDVRVEGLTIGADDYIIKTTAETELIARVYSGMRIRRLQQELKETQSYLSQQEKMAAVVLLASGVAHEINTPIAYVASNLASLDKYISRLAEYIQIVCQEIKHDSVEKMTALSKKMKIGYVTEDAKNLISESLEGIDRVAQIVQGLKNFSQVDLAAARLVDLTICLENTINMLRNELNDKVVLTQDFGPLPLTRCLVQQFNQVFMNILVNAAQAIDSHGEILIKTRSDTRFITISVSDSGCGIAKDQIHKIVEPFYTTKEIGKGTGLGLSVSSEIIKKHQGTLHVESELGKGTTVTITLPVTP